MPSADGLTEAEYDTALSDLDSWADQVNITNHLEASELLGVTTQRVRQLVAAKNIRQLRIGRTVLLNRADVLELVEARATRAAR